MAEIWVPAECRHSQPHGRRPSLLHTPAKHEVLIANVHRVRACRQSARSCTPLAEGRGPVEPWGPVQPSLPLHWGGGRYHTFALLSGLPSGVVPPPKTPAVLHVRSCDRHPSTSVDSATM